MIVVIALDCAFHLGVLSSRVHVTWALAAGGTLEDRPRYNKTRCFEPFPFPAATDASRRTSAAWPSSWTCTASAGSSNIRNWP